MPSLTRRDALRAGALSLAGLAGCSAVSNGRERQPELVSLKVVTYRAESVTMDVQLERNGEVELWRLVDLHAGGETGSASTFTPPAFPETPGRWRLAVRAPSTDERATLDLNADTYDDPCLRIVAELHSDSGLALHAGQKSPACRD